MPKPPPFTLEDILRKIAETKLRIHRDTLIDLVTLDASELLHGIKELSLKVVRGKARVEILGGDEQFLVSESEVETFFKKLQ